jgi:hypothetical protein
MTSRYLRSLGAASALLISMLTAATASAQYPVVIREPDGPRFRGGVNLEGGGLFVPGLVNLGAVGLNSQLGVQINNQWGVYFLPSLDILFGKLSGFSVGAGVLVDWTPPGVPISIGLGPEVGGFVALSDTVCPAGQVCDVTGASGAFYGARLHFAYYPVIVRYPWPRRKALAIGADFRFLDGVFGAGSTTPGTVAVEAGRTFGISPVVYIGYTAF